MLCLFPVHPKYAHRSDNRGCGCGLALGVDLREMNRYKHIVWHFTPKANCVNDFEQITFHLSLGFRAVWIAIIPSVRRSKAISSNPMEANSRAKLSAVGKFWIPLSKYL